MASPGEILIGEATHRLVRNAVLVEPLEPMELKGKAQPVQAWRLLGVVSGAPAVARRLDAPMVGRDEELARLRTAFEQSVRDQSCRLVTVFGTAGIGKSRLANEHLAEIRDKATVVEGRCLPYGEGITYWPLRDIVRDAAGGLTQARLEELVADDPDAMRIAGPIAAAIGIGEGSATPEETMWAVRRLFEHLARERPLIVGFDDLQWAEPTLLELIEYVVGWSREAPILIVCLARPDLLDRHPTWRALGESVSLNPLSAPEAEVLLEHLRGEVKVEPALLSRITQAAEGNPLYVEQLLAMITENGAAVGDLAIPPSIHALLAARLDRLPPEERAVLESASVVGKEFWRGAVAELMGDVERGSVGASLMTLTRKEFIEPARSIFPSEDGFRFRHILIRDAAYLGVPKETRAQLHEQYVGWLERTTGERASELDEIIGYHLERAHQYRQELGPVGEGASELATRAGERLASAGSRAISLRGDVAAAASLISRAVALLPEGNESRPALLTELAGLLMSTGEFNRAGDVLDEAREAAAGNPELEARVDIEREFHMMFAGSEEVSRTIPEVTARAIPILEEAGDDVGLARAWRLRGEMAGLAAHWGERAEALERAVEHARLAGDLREEATLVAFLAFSLYYGPTPVEEAIARCERFLEEVTGDRSLEAAIENVLAGLRAMLGEFDEARRLWLRASSQYEELGLSFRRAARSLTAAGIEILADNYGAAERELRWAYETLETMGDKGVRAPIAAYLGEVLYAEGRLEEAERFAQIANDLAAADDVVPQALWRGVRARVLATRGELEEAEALGRQAAELVESTDFPDLQATTFLAVAEVLETAGKAEEAQEFVDAAQALYEQKGNLVAARRIVREANTNRRRK